jgi:hypothetical protein
MAVAVGDLTFSANRRAGQVDLHATAIGLFLVTHSELRTFLARENSAAPASLPQGPLAEFPAVVDGTSLPVTSA